MLLISIADRALFFIGHRILGNVGYVRHNWRAMSGYGDARYGVRVFVIAEIVVCRLRIFRPLGRPLVGPSIGPRRGKTDLIPCRMFIVDRYVPRLYFLNQPAIGHMLLDPQEAGRKDEVGIKSLHYAV